MREIVFDTETTGFNPFTGDRLVEIGCVEIENYLPTGRVFHHYINPERDMPDGAFRIHGLSSDGLSSDYLKDFPVFSQVYPEFIDFIGSAKLIAPNAEFDMKFINWELSQVGQTPIPSHQAIDTLEIARRKFPGAANSLDALCKRFSIDNTSRVKHGALLDAELLAEVYLELMGGRQQGLALSGPEDEGPVFSEIPRESRVRHGDVRVSAPTGEERARHEKFIAEMEAESGQAALWLKKQ
ncbi:MAG: DNA polymerase III subunit epsilon [Alphaproteobacteria bacterium]|nr:DNA polymerase III subunit epsilon [Alphaproteobacteria bacterium]